MKKSTKIFSWVLLPLMFLSLAIGYAAVVDDMGIHGDAFVEGKPFEGVYIVEVEFISSTNGARNVSDSFTKPTNFSNTVNASHSGGSITYRVRVYNNTDVTYWYIGQEFVTDYESNSLIGKNNGITITTKDHPNDTAATFNDGDWVPPQTFRDFYVTYTYGSNALGYPVTFINFSFGIKMDAVHDQFLTVLNDKTDGGGYDYLSEIFDKKYASSKETVISNVGEEKAIFDKLFGSNLTINVDGVEVPVTVVIRRDNVDNRDTGDDYKGTSGAPTGCEYTIYITAERLTETGKKAEVYAVSYSNGGAASGAIGSGTWYQLGQLYEGTANVIDYDKTTAGVQGSIAIDTWIASEAQYTVANGITYYVGKAQGDQYDKLKTLEEIMSTNDQDIFNDIDNRQILKNVYAIVYNSNNISKPGYTTLKEAFEAAAPFYNVMNNGQEVKVKRNCTRAEIIPYILNIQHALDYYNELN